MAARSNTVCKFFLDGRCKFGSKCRFQHPSGGSVFSDRGGGYRGQREERENSVRLFSDHHYFGEDRHGYQDGKERGGNRGWGGGRGGWSSGSWGGDGGGREGNWDGGGGRGGGRGGSWGGRRGGGWSGTRDNQTKHRSENWSKGGRNQSGEGRNSWSRHEGKWTGDTDTMNPNDIATDIRMDFEEWMNSAATMWPLSCYGKKDANGCFPGLIDISPDELRWEAYQANTTNNLSKYIQVLSELSLKQLNVMGKYRKITAEDVQLLKSNPGVVNDSIWSLSTAKQDDSNSGGLFGLLHSASNLPSNSIVSSPSSSSLFEGQKPLTQSLFGPSDSGKQTDSSLSSAPDSAPSGFGSSAVHIDKKTIGGGLFDSQSSQSLQLWSQNSSTTTQALVNVPTQGSCAPSVPNPTQKTLKTILNYTQTRELTKSELEAYKADKFVLGQIPEHAPIVT